MERETFKADKSGLKYGERATFNPDKSGLKYEGARGGKESERVGRVGEREGSTERR